MFDTKMYNEAIIDAIESLITLSGQSYRDGILLPNFHVKNENVVPLEDRGKFPTGMINFGMAHGMAAALSVLSISKKMGISLYAVVCRNARWPRLLAFFFDRR